MASVANIGLPVARPKRGCDDPQCPFHGSLRVRKKAFEGRVVSAKMEKAVVVLREYARYISKYHRYERRRSRIPAHNPPCISAKEGDRVRIAECKPISKTISFVVVEKAEEG